MAPIDTPRPALPRISQPPSFTSSGSAVKPKDIDVEIQPDDTTRAAGQSDSDGEGVGRQIQLEAGNSIKYRTCSWQKTAALLFSEYICLAIMSFPWTYSVLGILPGLILTIFVAVCVQYTSLTIWKFCLRNPHVRDVCDIGQHLFGDSRIAWYLTALMFLLNNTFIQGLHCLVGSTYLNTVTGHPTCTVVYALVMAMVSFVFSLPRTFNTLSKVATFSALFTFISVLLATIFAGVEPHPAGYPSKGEPIVNVFPMEDTSFVRGLNGFLNISYTFIGQITIPSFISEMTEPEDFWKSVSVVTVCEVIVFSLVGSIIYVYTGNQYMTTPAFGSIENDTFKKVSFSFMIPTLIFLGVLYASVSARFIFFRLFEGTHHKGNHTAVGWTAWIGILFSLWSMAFVIAEVIPFFSDLLSIMSALFDSFFGFIFWGVAYIRMRYTDHGRDFYKTRGLRGWIGFLINVFLIGCGFFFLGPGTYASVMGVIKSYREGTVGHPFSCADTSV